MKNVFSCLIVVLISIFSLTGCNNTTDYKFLQPNDKIAKIEIVIVGEREDIKGKKLSEVQQVMDVKKELLEEEGEKLIEDLKKIDCFNKYNPPGYMDAGLEAFKISYDNGDYELINYRAQATYKNSKYDRAGLYYFDKDQFNELLYKYLD
ncbi:hypothetical protein RBG61_00405 [Paludicola sp. MB14-C6]|uniref:hypothetical protein n=1 Tax=Paludihabitans sp. MB14-C6 TaxID=3070656 RepID=UPI0027DB5EEC|nr:hypothetical protein [Paludicola sp. MB14-C6]WMJ23152.1 hypothetical protein RBG61_00405 [Paludicola sp. MB14-C6]